MKCNYAKYGQVKHRSTMKFEDETTFITKKMHKINFCWHMRKTKISKSQFTRNETRFEWILNLFEKAGRTSARKKHSEPSIVARSSFHEKRFTLVVKLLGLTASRRVVPPLKVKKKTKIAQFMIKLPLHRPRNPFEL